MADDDKKAKAQPVIRVGNEHVQEQEDGSLEVVGASSPEPEQIKR